MAEHDLVIRNGTVVDGTGAPRATGRRRRRRRPHHRGRRASTGTGRREIDADGLVVAPGWVDIHTHYDGQASWDPHPQPRRPGTASPPS